MTKATKRGERLIAGAREDLENAKAQRRSAAKAYSSGQAKKSDYEAAVAEIDRRIERLEATIAGYEAAGAAPKRPPAAGGGFRPARLQLDQGPGFTFFIFKWADNGDLIETLGPWRSEAAVRDAAAYLIAQSGGRYRWHSHKWLGDAKS